MNTYKIWDIPVRLFHWCLVASIIVCFVSIKKGNLTVHQYAGIFALSLVLFRIIWGVVGSSTARFTDFIKGPKTIIHYLKTGQSSTEGHNPLGAYMVLALLLVVLIQTITGLFLEDNSFIYQDSPLAKLITGKTRGTLKMIHVYGEYVIYGMVVLHVFAGVSYLFIKKQNLIRTMITGLRPQQEMHQENGFNLRGDRPFLAFAIYLVIASLLYYFLFYYFK